MNDEQQLIVELENALTRARKDVTEAANQKPELPEATILKLREAAHSPWCALESAKKSSTVTG
jgi:hypothetical protein